MIVFDWPVLLWHRLLVGLAGRLRHPRAAVRLRSHHRALSLHHHGLGGDPGCDVVADAGARERGWGMRTAARTCWRGSTASRCTCPSASTAIPLRPSIASSTSGWPHTSRSIALWTARTPCRPASATCFAASPPARGCWTGSGPVFPVRASVRGRACATARRAARVGRRHGHDPSAGGRHSLRARRREVTGRRLAGRFHREGAAWRLSRAPAAPASAFRPVSSRVPLGVSAHGHPRPASALAEAARAPPGARDRQVAGPSPVRSGSAARIPVRRRGPGRTPVSRMGPSAPRLQSGLVPRHRTNATSVERPALDPETADLARRVRRQFEALREVRRWTRGLESGDELDLDAFVDSVADRRGRGFRSPRLYQQRESRLRDLAVAVLLDTSRSTAAWVGEHRVIEVAWRSMAILRRRSPRPATSSPCTDSRATAGCACTAID